jgi:hypothetical protein
MNAAPIQQSLQASLRSLGGRLARALHFEMRELRGALNLPDQMATEVKHQRSRCARVLNLIFDLIASDQLIAGGTGMVPRSVASEKLSGQDEGQLTVLNAFAHS